MKKIIFCFFCFFCFNLASADENAATENPPTETTNKFYHFLESITGTTPSLYQLHQDQKRSVEDKKYVVTLYQPTYVLPFYYTEHPYYSIYANQTPNHENLDKAEFKAQLSFLMPIIQHIAGSKFDLNLSYTQLSYWQVYAKSQYFRETDYNPALFISNNFINNWQYHLGIEHQSNGRGGAYERSWNRAFGDLIFSKDNWMVDITPWILIFKNESSSLHNPTIQSYMGNGQVQIAYKYGENTFSLMSRNNLASNFKRGAVEVTWSHPIYSRFSFYVQGFSGYGQSLIEYNHFTNSIGAGITLNDWL
jgi:phospholipase A1